MDLAEGVSATEIAMAIHGDARFRNQDIRVGCIIAGRENLISAERERIETRMQREELAREKQELRERAGRSSAGRARVVREAKRIEINCARRKFKNEK